MTAPDLNHPLFISILVEGHHVLLLCVLGFFFKVSVTLDNTCDYEAIVNI